MHPLRFRPLGSSGTHEIPVPAIPEPHLLDDSGLPKAGPLRVDDVELGPGRPVDAVRPCLTSSGPRRPRLWVSDAPVPDAALVWRRLVDRFPQTGLWPLVLHSLAGDDSRPWDAGELEPASGADVDTLDPARLLAEGWADALVLIGQNPRVAHLDPFGARFPGLADALPRSAPSSVSLTALPPGGAARIGLVRCRRPADAVALAGWLGAINVTGPAEISAVLRSWEERFGVVLAGLGFDTMTLLVPHPPVDEQQGLLIAAEIAAFCPDALWQGHATTIAGLARLLVDVPVWHLWFD